MIVLLLIMGAFLVLAPGNAAAEQDGDFTYSISGSPATATVVGYTGPGGPISIPSTLGGYSTVSIGNGAFNSVSGHAITSVVIPDSVTTIAEQAFQSCTLLASVTLGGGVASLGFSAFSHCSALTSVTIPDSVTTIGDYVFDHCFSIASISIGTGVTSIGEGAFSECEALTSMVIPNGVGVLGPYAFFHCYNLSSVQLSNSLTAIGSSTFSRCNALTSVTVPNSVTSIGGGAFYQCAGLISATLSSSLTSLGDRVFMGSPQLASITFPGLVVPVSIGTDWIADTNAGIRGHAYASSGFPLPPGVWNGLTMGAVIPETEDYSYSVIDENATITGYLGAGGEITLPSTLGGYPVVAIGPDAFDHEAGITAVTIPESVTIIGHYAFSFCSSLASVNTGNGVTTIEYGAFYSCTSLTTISIGSGVVSIEHSAFAECSGLTSINIPVGVTSIATYAFNFCSSMLNLDVAVGNPNYASINGVLYNKAITTLIQFPIGRAGSFVIPNSITTVGNSSFSGCPSLGTVALGSGVRSIGSLAFSYCPSLISIYFYGLTAPTDVGAEWIASAPAGLRGHADVASNFPAPGNTFSGLMMGDTSPVPEDYLYSVSDNKATITGYVGAGGAITIPSTLGGYPVVAIGYNAFSSDLGHQVTAVIIPYGVTSIAGYAFDHCALLTSVTIPDSVNNIETYAFYFCTALTSVTIPDNVTSIGAGTFWFCTSLISLDLGHGLQSIGASAFSSCTALTHVTIPDTVIYISSSAFASCTALTTLTLSSGLSTIGNYAFYECSALTSVVIPESVTSIGNNAFAYCTSLGGFDFPYRVAIISDRVLQGCILLAAVTVGSGVTTIGWNAFAYCEIMISITFRGTEAPSLVASNWLLGTNDGLRGHAYTASDFPAPGTAWNGLMMGAVIVVVPSSPTNLTAVPGNAQAALNWTAPADDGGSPIDYYIIFQDDVDVLHINAISTTLAGLVNGRSYSFAVSAHNALGAGDLSSVVAAVPYTVANAPTGLTAIAGNAQATLNWTAPGVNGGRVVDYYVVYQDGIALATYPAGLTVLITGLTNGQSYAFRVAAHNLAGNGTQSASATALPATVPGAPTGLTATPGAGKVSLAWQAPASNGGSPITGYRVYLLLLGGSRLLETVGPSTFVYADGSGTVGTNSTYFVVATNAVGAGANSTSASAAPQTANNTDSTMLYVGIAIAIIAVIAIAVMLMRKRK